MESINFLAHHLDKTPTTIKSSTKTPAAPLAMMIIQLFVKTEITHRVSISDLHNITFFFFFFNILHC